MTYREDYVYSARYARARCFSISAILLMIISLDSEKLFSSYFLRAASAEAGLELTIKVRDELRQVSLPPQPNMAGEIVTLVRWRWVGTTVLLSNTETTRLHCMPLPPNLLLLEVVNTELQSTSFNQMLLLIMHLA